MLGAECVGVPTHTDALHSTRSRAVRIGARNVMVARAATGNQPYLQVLHSFSDSLDLAGALEAEDDGGLGRRVDGAHADHQVLEVESAAKRKGQGVSGALACAA